MTRIATILTAVLVVLLGVSAPAEAKRGRPHKPVVIQPVVIPLPDLGPIGGPVVCPRSPVAHPVCIPVVR